MFLSEMFIYASFKIDLNFILTSLKLKAFRCLFFVLLEQIMSVSVDFVYNVIAEFLF